MTALFLAVAAPLPLAAQTLEVSGWLMPAMQGERPSLALGDDPILGRQACPPLTRTNLTTGKSEDLLVRRVVEEFRDAKRGASWHIELRTGIYWWSGEEVSSQAIATFAAQAIPEIVAARSGGIWAVPAFKAEAAGAGSVKILWEQAPVFGPYVLNGAPLWRPSAAKRAGDLAYECAGLYRARSASFGMELTPNPAYKLRKGMPVLHVHSVGSESAGSSSKAPGDSWMRFRAASDAPKSCSRLVDLPVATMLFWNTQKGLAAASELRQQLTHVTPRGALLREGAGSYGELLSGPIPKDHPGYARQVLVRPFDYVSAAISLDKLGYKRRSIDGPRATDRGEPLKLVIATQAESTGIVEKVLTDSYVAMGIRVQFRADLKEPQEADGQLASVALDWPRADLMATFHSRTQEAPFWPLKDLALDQALERYALSLTEPRPDFALLQAVHKKIFELEPVTVIMQHKACVEAGAIARLGSVKLSDPDWFRRLIL